MWHVTAVRIIDFVRAAESRLLSILAGFASPQFNGSSVIFLNNPVCIAGVDRHRNQIEECTVALF
jgi:hypothetical protein